MINLEPTVLEMQIMLKCNEGSFSKGDLSRTFRKYSLVEKQKAIESLKYQGLILVQPRPKIGSTKVPIFYSLTEAGKKWVIKYKKSYP